MVRRSPALINKDTLAYICFQLKVSISFLARKTSIPEEKVSKWIDTTDDSLPTINQAKDLSKILKIPLSGFECPQKKQYHFQS